METMINDFTKLKNFMSPAKNVEEWNDLRDAAKKVFAQETINELDTSGYIKEVLRENK